MSAQCRCRDLLFVYEPIYSFNLSLRVVMITDAAGAFETSAESARAARHARTAETRSHNCQEHPSRSSILMELRLYVYALCVLL